MIILSCCGLSLVVDWVSLFIIVAQILSLSDMKIDGELLNLLLIVLFCTNRFLVTLFPSSESYITKARVIKMKWMLVIDKLFSYRRACIAIVFFCSFLLTSSLTMWFYQQEMVCEFSEFVTLRQKLWMWTCWNDKWVHLEPSEY